MHDKCPRGASGENGCFQIMPKTWVAWSKQVYGHIEEQTPKHERYVVTKIVESWVNSGLSNERIFLRYNAGNASACSSGYNSQGIWYNSCEYVAQGMKQLSMLY